MRQKKKKKQEGTNLVLLCNSKSTIILIAHLCAKVKLVLGKSFFLVLTKEIILPPFCEIG